MFESPNALVGRWAAPESGKQEGQKLKKSFRGGTLRASNPRRRRRGVRGAKGRDAEGVQGMGTGYPPPQPTGGFCGIERRKLSQRGPGQSPGEKTIFTARCYASAVLAMGLCLSVSVSVTSWREFY